MTRPNGLLHANAHMTSNKCAKTAHWNLIPECLSGRADHQGRCLMTEHWLIEPPHAGTTYHVTADTWNADHTERTIHSVEIVEDANGRHLRARDTRPA